MSFFREKDIPAHLIEYFEPAEIGNEPTLQAYLDEMVSVFRDLRRVLRDDGVFWLNIGDSYNNFRSQMGPGQALHGRDDLRGKRAPLSGARGVEGLKEKDLMMVPARLAIALQADGWYLRSQMPWAKRNVMPESVKDRPTSAIEYVYMFTKSTDYFYDHVAVQQPGAIAAGTRAAKGSNVRSELKDVNGRPPEYWEYTGTRNFRNTDLFFTSLEKPHNLITDAEGKPLALDVNPYPFKGAHFATFPVKLVEPLITAATSEKGCCSNCGVPWRRIAETKYKVHENWFGDKQDARHSRGSQGTSYKEPVGIETLRWEPCCNCPCANPIPCTVLDPFAGACTTLMVADRMGRNSLGIELNPHYARMGLKRIQEDRAKRAKS